MPSPAASVAPAQLPAPDRLRFYTPNLIAPGMAGSPARDTDRAQIDSLFTDEAAMNALLDSVDVYGFFGASLARADAAFEQMLARAIPMLERHGVKVGLEVGGPLGYAPPTVYGGDSGGQNGIKSAQLDLGPTRIGKIERLGGTVDYLMLDGALRRTIRNGEHSRPHAAYVAIGADHRAVRYVAVTPGSAGNGISVAHVVGPPGAPLSVTLEGKAVTVTLAADSSGAPISTAREVQAAVRQSAAATIVDAGLLPGSQGGGVAVARPRTWLAYGDDGLNLTIQESVAELVAYIRTVHAARPGIRFVLLENTILWPYEGRAGYQSVAYPGGQRPDFHAAWEALIAQLDAAGLRSLLVGMHNDHPIEYPERLIQSIHRYADDWYGRTLRLQAQVEADGVAFAQLFNSVWGGDPAQDAQHPAPFASDAYFQQRVLAHVQRHETYRLAQRPDLGQSAHFAFDAFLYYPRVVGPASVEHSTDDTYLEALALFESFSVGAAPAALHPPHVALLPGTRSAVSNIAVSASWSDSSAGDLRVQLQRREDAGSWADVPLRDSASGATRLRLSFGRRHELRVRALLPGGGVGPWLISEPLTLTVYDHLDPAVELSGAWRSLDARAALGGSLVRTRQRGSSAWFSAGGQQVAWIGQRGRRHGRAQVHVNGEPAGYVGLRANRLRSRQVLFVSTSVGGAPTTLAIGNASRRAVDVDAFVVLHVNTPLP